MHNRATHAPDDTPAGPAAPAPQGPAEPKRRQLRPRQPSDGGPGRAASRSVQAEMARLKAEVHHLKALREAEDHHLRRDLIANVSHDLRTPLVSLRGYLEMLVTKGDALPCDQRAEYLAVALRQSDGLARLIDELFDLARLDVASVVLHREAFAPLEFVGDVLQKFQIQAQRQEVALNLDAAPDLPFVRGDLGLVERALDNLIGNALKYTPAGGCVSVALRARPQQLEMAVSDTGSGIAPEDLPHVFDRCYRGRGAERGIAGAGLGLAITHRIAELHGSRITVASRPGEGTRFAFELPLASVDPT